MSNDVQTVSHGKHAGVGVTGWGHSKVVYSPSRDNPPALLRPGATDALKCPSVDLTGIPKPYWGDSN